MSPRTNSRLAGFFFLFYIADGIASMMVMRRVTGSGDAASKLASIAAHESLMRFEVLLILLTCVAAVGLGLALYGLTRDYDHDLALLALCFRVIEGAVGATGAIKSLGLLEYAKSGTADPAVGAWLLQGSSMVIAATLFAIASTIYCWIFLRSRTVPAVFAWTGLVASLLLIVALPLQLLGYLSGPVTNYVWAPMALFEVTFGIWLLIKGARTYA